MNAIVTLRLEPIYSFLGSINIISASPVPTVPILILLGLLGALIAAWPLFMKNEAGHRNLHPLNVIVAHVLASFFILIGYVLGEEMYRCEVLGVPNCD